MTSQNNFVALAALENQEYLRQRIAPQPNDPLYLHLSDLRVAMGGAISQCSRKRVLDYGCGGSPYRPLFNAACYHRADIPGTPNLDFEFGEDSRLSANDRDYDCVLSTQVLEHVKHVHTYLEECRRVLHPEGTLILTTHGTFNDHGCPHDFWRWTADGLRSDLERSGFKAEKILKLTTGPRALLFLNQQKFDRPVIARKLLTAWILRFTRLIYIRRWQRRLNITADQEYADCRVVSADAPGHELYIGLLTIARLYT